MKIKLTNKYSSYLTIFFVLLALKAFPQSVVTGIVKSTDGEPLPGVSVLVKGTTVGTVSDLNGRYSISVSDPNSALVFSYIGFIKQEIALTGRTSLDVTMAEDSNQLEQVVVVGYGTQKKVTLTGSVAVLDKEALVNRPITQTSQALQGQLAGVTVTQDFGMPGNDAGTIRIRGIGTLGSNDALVLVDGIPGSLNDINPNDIESLSVLKDASASIYGSRAANGVILVTTKRGKTGISLTYNTFLTSQVPTDLPQLVDGLTYMNLRNEQEINNGKAPLFSQADIEEYKQNVGTEPYFNTNWYDFAMKNSAAQHSHNLTFRGGGEKVSSLVSLAYVGQDALVANTDFNRFSLRFNNNFQATKRLGLQMDGFLRKEDSDYPNVPGGGSRNGIIELFRMMSEIPAIEPGMWADGTFGAPLNGQNPLAYIERGGRDKTTSSRIQLNLRANYDLADWLKLEVAYAPKYLSDNDVNNVKHYAFKRTDGSTGTSPAGLNGLTNRNSRTIENFYQGIVRFNKAFGKHAASALAGYEHISNRTEFFSASRQNFPLPDYTVLNAGDENYRDNSGSGSEWVLASFFGKLNYAFSEKYLFEAALRRDGSSRFATSKRFGWFPSFSAAWRLSEEPFLKNINTISNLKFRASWGQMGNQEIGNYPFLDLISITQPYYFGGITAQGAAQTELPNRVVTWETSTILNAGIDFGLFNNKLSGSFEVYNKNTKDILYTREIPLIIGLQPSEQNIAEVRNTGWDLQLSWTDKIRKFNYGVDFVLSDVRNKVLDLNGKPQYGRNAIFENEEFQAFYGYESLGIYRTQEDLDKYPRLNSNVKIGDLILKDQNGDNKLDPTNDKKIIGSNIPRYTFGGTFKVGYKNFDVSVFMQGVGKKDIYYGPPQSPAYGGNYATYQMDRLVPDDPSTIQTARWPRLGASTATFEDNSFYVYNSAYLRCKNLMLGYNIPSGVLSKIKINGARLFFSGTNLFTIDSLPIDTIDPEAPNSAIGVTYYPNVKTYSLGLNVNF